MALINCSECGKEISDKAASCPNCGNPINKTSSSNIAKQTTTTQASGENLLHCPKCNSTQLSTNKKGFSGGKALAGAVLTGGIGLLAGTIGSSNVMVTCLNCGYKYKAGDYWKEKNKVDQKKDYYALSKQLDEDFASGKKSLVPHVIASFIWIIFLIGSIFLLFSKGVDFLGYIFIFITILSVAFFINFFNEIKRKSKINS